MVTVTWLGSSDDFEVKASDIDKAPMDAVRQGARLYATIALNLQQVIDRADKLSRVATAVQRIVSYIDAVSVGDDDYAEEDDSKEDDRDYGDNWAHRNSTRGGI